MNKLLSPVMQNANSPTPNANIDLTTWARAGLGFRASKPTLERRPQKRAECITWASYDPGWQVRLVRHSNQRLSIHSEPRSRRSNDSKRRGRRLLQDLFGDWLVPTCANSFISTFSLQFAPLCSMAVLRGLGSTATPSLFCPNNPKPET